MKLLIRVSISLIGCFLYANAVAGTITCSGTIAQLAYHANNKMMIRLSSMNYPVYFCNPDAEWSVSGTTYKTGPETCKTLYSTFLAAKLAGKSINSMYFDGDHVPESCDGWERWKPANIRYYSID